MGVFLSPLSNEYLLAAEHYDLNRWQLLELCRGAVEAIFGGEEEKKRLRELVRGIEEEVEVDWE